MFSLVSIYGAHGMGAKAMGKWNKFWHWITTLTFRNIFKNIFFLVITGFLIVIGYRILSPYAMPNANDTSSSDKDLLLFFISSFSSWIVSAWFATFTSTDKIDTIAEQSFDKMINLTVQLDQAKLFLRNAIDAGEREYRGRGETFARKALEHRIDGAMNMIDLIQTSNEALANDWLGVVSGSMARQLREKKKGLDQLSKVVGGGPSVDAPLDSSSNMSDYIPGAGRLLRAASDPALGPAAKISQTGHSGDGHSQMGIMVIDVIRDTWAATGTGKLDPQMAGVPRVAVTLTNAPSHCDRSRISHHSATGTNRDFNINLRSTVRNTFLPQGQYVFEYKADVERIVEP